MTDIHSDVNFRNSYEKMVREIETAFKNVPVPLKKHISYIVSVEGELRDFIQEYDELCTGKEDVISDLIDRNCDSLPRFSSKAYPFFVGAYIKRSLQLWFDKDTTQLMWVVYHIAPLNFGSYNIQQNKFLTPIQKEAIQHFLKFIVQYHDDEEFVELAQKTLDTGIYDTAICLQKKTNEKY